MLKRTKIDLSEERRILGHLIASTPFLIQLRDVVDPALFESGFARTISGWVMDFYRATGEAPGKAIQDVYLKRRGEVPDEEELDLVAEYLRNLSKDWAKAEVANVVYSSGTALEYFKLRSLERLRDQLTAQIEARDHAEAERSVGSYVRVEKPSGQGVSLFANTQAILDAFSQTDEVLLNLPGALGAIIGPIVRGDFIGVAAPPKGGKSWWLWYLGYRAALIGHKTLVVSLEMTQAQMLRRGWQCFLGEPRAAKEVKMPRFKEIGEGKFVIEERTMQKKGVPVDAESIKKSQAKYRKALRTGDVRLECRASDSMSPRELEILLDNLEFYEGWVPDVVVVDYADIMVPNDSRTEYRHKLDAIWKSLRGLAQKRNIAIITGSQTGRATMGGKKDAKASDASEDMRKVAHVTKWISVNATTAEKSAGIFRIECDTQREGGIVDDQAVVLACLDIGRPYLDSQLKRDCVLNDGKFDDDE